MPPLLPRLGIWGASIDVSPVRSWVIQGENVDTEIVMRGGNAAQDVRKLVFTLTAETGGQGAEQEVVVRTEEIPAPFTIESGERREYPLSLHVPLKTPVTTLGDTSVRLEGVMDLVRARNANQTLELAVEPSPILTALLEEFDRLGFVLMDEVVREAPIGSTATGADDWNQVFLFRVSGPPFSQWIRRLAMAISKEQGEIQVLLTTGSTDSSLEELLYRTLDVGHHRFTIEAKVSTIRSGLEAHIYEALPRNQ